MNQDVKASFEVSKVNDYKRIIFPGTYIQGRNIIKDFIKILSLEKKNLFILATPSSYGEIIPSSLNEWEKTANVKLEKFNGECCLKEIERIIGLIKDSHFNPEYIIGLGGGKVLDTAKSVAFRLETKCGVIPTIASSDAPCIGVSVLYDEMGRFKELEFLPNPQYVLADSEILAKAPVRYLAAGIGDALSTWLEAQSCEISKSPNYTNSFRTDTGYFIAKLCFDNLMKYAKQAVIDCQKGIVTDAVEHIIETNILLSGVGVENTGLSSAHFTQFGLSQLEETKGMLHGEEVTIGCLVWLFLNKKSKAEMDAIYDLCESVGLPTTLEQIGIKLSANIDQILMHIAKTACNVGQPNCHEPFKVTPEDIVKALKDADAYGRARKKL